MSLRTRITLALVLVVATFVALDHALQRVLVVKTFRDLEYREAAAIHKRARHLVEEEARSLAARGQARWFHLRGDAPQHSAENALSASRIDLLFVCEDGGKVIWQEIEDPQTREPRRLREFPRSALLPGHPLLAVENESDIVTGIIETEGGLMLVASQPIAGLAAQVSGRVIAGRFVSQAVVAEWEKTLGERLDIWPASNPPMDELGEDLVAQALGDPSEAKVRTDPEGVQTLGVLTDIQRIPVMLMRTRMGHELSDIGLRSARYALLSTLGVACLILLTLVEMLRRMVIGPLDKVTRHAVAIGRSDESEARLGMVRDDEIGVLAREFDHMLDKLSASRTELIRTSRLAGMSEIATGALHNVGNALTAVGFAAHRIEGTTNRFPLDDLHSVNAVLAENQDDLVAFLTEDPRGSSLPGLLLEMEREFQDQRTALSGELEDLESGIDTIRELVRSQQAYAGHSSVLEAVFLEEEIEAAIDVCVHSYLGTLRMEIERDLEEVPSTYVDRHKLREILVNLIRNAQQSLELAQVEPKRLTVHLSQPADDMVRIVIEDNGCGIAAEDLQRVFNAGFSTREQGHGFGLHAAGNSACELGGRLVGESSGPGHGARFTLTIPFLRERPCVEKSESPPLPAA